HMTPPQFLSDRRAPLSPVVLCHLWGPLHFRPKGVQGHLPLPQGERMSTCTRGQGEFRIGQQVSIPVSASWRARDVQLAVDLMKPDLLPAWPACFAAGDGDVYHQVALQGGADRFLHVSLLAHTPCGRTSTAKRSMACSRPSGD